MKNKYKKINNWMPAGIHITSDGVFLIIDAKELDNMTTSEREKFIRQKTEQGFTIRIVGNKD